MSRRSALCLGFALLIPASFGVALLGSSSSSYLVWAVGGVTCFFAMALGMPLGAVLLLLDLKNSDHRQAVWSGLLLLASGLPLAVIMLGSIALGF
jgi:hypothetical protein